MSLVIDSKRASYGDDMRSFQANIVSAMTAIENGFGNFEALRDVIAADPDMTQADVDEIEGLIEVGYSYTWNHVKALVPPGLQT